MRTRRYRKLADFDDFSKVIHEVSIGAILGYVVTVGNAEENAEENKSSRQFIF